MKFRILPIISIIVWLIVAYLWGERDGLNCERKNWNDWLSQKGIMLTTLENGYKFIKIEIASNEDYRAIYKSIKENSKIELNFIK